MPKIVSLDQVFRRQIALLQRVQNDLRRRQLDLKKAEKRLLKQETRSDEDILELSRVQRDANEVFRQVSDTARAVAALFREARQAEKKGKKEAEVMTPDQELDMLLGMIPTWPRETRERALREVPVVVRERVRA